DDDDDDDDDDDSEDEAHHSHDDDVAAEKRRALRSAADPSIAVRITRLNKVYHKNPFHIRSKRDNHAVKGVSYCIENNSVFCLLGHNGSGKSTTIGMLTGLIQPSGELGDAFVFGESVRNSPELVRRMIGVCPQHDILWPELTAYEHLYLFAQLRGIDQETIPAMIEEKLQGVSLLPVQDHPSSTFSGGMKRRLSVAISSIGDPQLIIMDEPTTGMDPKSVQHVWHMIQTLKKDRSILLTTHSMEEAEILADRIAIMNLGEIMCIGSSLHLKNKYGDGYRLTISVRPHAAERVCQFVAEAMPSTRLISKTGDILIFSLPFEASPSAPNPTSGLVADDDDDAAAAPGLHEALPADMVAWLQRFEDFITADESLVMEWGLSMPTLEAVFHRVTDHKRVDVVSD
ncbi:MAG: ABC transporter A family member, partial [archaeon]|nr:ABC transporter A family member [archaeon]